MAPGRPGGGRRRGAGGWLTHAGGEAIDLRSLCLIRETLARHDGLADFAFAMQGLGMGAVSLFGTPEQRRWLERTRAGAAISAFALTEPGAGSDVAQTATTARREGEDWVLDGEKTYISNGGIADVYVILARSGEAPGARGLSAFLMPADAPGLSIAERIEVIAPHPLARLRLDGVRLPAGALIGEAGAGFKVVMAVLDLFRATVGAAALGFARRALDEALARVHRPRPGGGRLIDHQIVEGHLADMALEIDAAALLIYRAAWTRDVLRPARITREAAMAKLYATEAAQRVIDTAVQLHGGDGVRHGETVERLYREIRALRIYEGASDVQRIIIARAVAGGFQGGER
ncbi:acyl-CoA dehydrogenase family protein [Paracoccus sanguinis]|uniref:acyl-CoA dehydrogenase family protein n=1 Tax=Paracoccus sanguinis TaxID=1545044 RepID=UPI0009DDF042|nr:acyl-CoA dehydrogenase family protein [Paracoccus sanguinis]